MTTSRDNPSPRYRELIGLYRTMHRVGDAAHGLSAEKTFPGQSLPRQAHRIRPLIARTQAKTILDYGSGKGIQYRPAPIKQEGVVRWNSIQEYWGVETIRCYDPAYEPHSELPTGRFDGVVCTDVLEHCPEQDLDWIIDGFFAFAEKFVFANVACYPAAKRLPNGENAHCTIKPAAFWKARFEAAAARHPGVLWELWLEESYGQGRPETRLANFEPQRAAAAPVPRAGATWRMS
jgi:hypothetical protein